MTPFAGSLRKTWPLFFLAAGTLAAALLGWHIFSLTQTMAKSRQSASDLILTRGRALRQRLEASALQPPGGKLEDLAFPGPQSASEVRLVQVALYLGGRPLWVFPPGTDASAPETPGPSADRVEHSGALWVYTYGYADGRCLSVVFELPEYARQGSRVGLLTLFESSSILGLLLLLGLLAWRIAQPLVGEDLGHEAPTARGSNGEPSTQAVVALFQQTLKELRRRTEELEELHHRERSRAEDGERMAEALCENLEAGYLRFGEDGHLSGVNAAARGLLGLQQVPRLGDEARQLLEGREGILKVVEEVRSTRALALREEVPGAPGLLLQVVGIPLFNLLHQLKGYLILLRDQTGVYQMRRTLREREALSRLGEVAAGVAHEVRNSLSTISTRLRLLNQDLPALGDNPSFKALSDEARNLEQVMQNLLFFARPLPLEREPVDLRQLLEEERHSVIAAGGDMEIVVEGEAVLAQVDREALARALRNLTRNALEALSEGPEGGRSLKLSVTRRADGMALVRVEDGGPGLPEGADEAAFTPFFSQKPGGTGLGLAIARKIAREHGGDLLYFPSGLGGAGFELSVPEVPPRPA